MISVRDGPEKRVAVVSEVERPDLISAASADHHYVVGKAYDPENLRVIPVSTGAHEEENPPGSQDPLIPPSTSTDRPNEGTSDVEEVFEDASEEGIFEESVQEVEGSCPHIRALYHEPPRDLGDSVGSLGGHLLPETRSEATSSKFSQSDHGDGDDEEDGDDNLDYQLDHVDRYGFLPEEEMYTKSNAVE